MTTPHKHAECIKAWADGKKIQVAVTDKVGWFDTRWPEWRQEHKYRVKPEPIPAGDLLRDCWYETARMSVSYSWEIVAQRFLTLYNEQKTQD